jgi:phosphoserine phosphatase
MPATATRRVSEPAQSRGLVVFDLDQALLAQGPAWGTEDRLRVAAARVKEARSLRTGTSDPIRPRLEQLRFVAGAKASITRLQRHGIVCALVSLGWDLVLEGVAPNLGIEHYLGTGLEPTGRVVHVWHEDRGDYTQRLAAQLQLPKERSLLVAEPTPLARLAEQLIQRWR